MGILLQLVTCFACAHAVMSQPLQDYGSPLYEDYRLNLAKRDAFYPFKQSLLSTLGFLENSREGIQNQRKKAVDSTFIRFGRSSSSRPTFRPILSPPENILNEPQSDESKPTPQRYVLNHKGCQISSSRELFQALMNNPNCIRVIPKVKRENVNDTFIRFGKRSIPSEKQFESDDSGDV